MCRGDAPVLAQRGKRGEARWKFSHERGTTGDSPFKGELKLGWVSATYKSKYNWR